MQKIFSLNERSMALKLISSLNTVVLLVSYSTLQDKIATTKTFSDNKRLIDVYTFAYWNYLLKNFKALAKSDRPSAIAVHVKITHHGIKWDRSSDI